MPKLSNRFLSLTAVIAVFTAFCTTQQSAHQLIDNVGYSVSDNSALDVSISDSVVDDVRDAAVRISDPTSTVYGSGSYVKYAGRGMIVTAAHVVRNSRTMLVYERDGLEPVVGHTVYLDAQNDLAFLLLEAPMESRDSIRINLKRSKRLDAGEPIIYTGFPSRHDLLTIFGNVAGFSAADNYIVHSYAWMGASGSGVYSKRGHLIGVLVAIDVARNPMDRFGVAPPQLIEDVVHVIPIWKVDRDILMTNISLKEAEEQQ